MTLLKGNKGKYRALVTDINLVGRIDGWEVARRAREIDPAFPSSTSPARMPTGGLHTAFPTAFS